MSIDSPNDSESVLFDAVKNGSVLQLDRDPHPGTTRYLVIDAHGTLVLFPKEAQSPRTLPIDAPIPALPRARPDRDAHFRRAFDDLKPRISSTGWASSAHPYTDLLSGLHALAAQPAVAADIATYLDRDPSVENAVEMLFTSIAMSARADWRVASPDIRGVVARGWFLGRWVPTFLVLDGPILRFFNSSAFRQQNPPVPILREVRSFFKTADFMALRHAFAHWSFAWTVAERDSTIVGSIVKNDVHTETVRASRKEADAFHIITFGFIQALDDVFLRSRRTRSIEESEG